MPDNLRRLYHIVKRCCARKSGERINTFGRNAGDFHWMHNIAIDSLVSGYTSEVDTGKRATRSGL